MPFIKSEKRRQGKKCADTDFQKIVAQYGTTEVLDPGGTAFSEPTLISLASGYEAATQVREHNLPTFPGYAPSTNIQGTTPTRPHHPFSKKDAAKKKPHNM